ncbi:MAG: GNAT family N-acetyltransferase [Candidatus Aminicenantes bacterium]|nr:GNAT family N-acetyltransferase [Candidatus Aminicenantes bacterium]
MEKKETLKDGTQLVIRDLTNDDIDRLMALYGTLPLADRRYLRLDVTKKDVVENRVRSAKNRGVTWIGVFCGDKLCAEGRLELPGEEWRKKHGEIRLVVSWKFRRKGLGLMILRELYLLAAEKKIEKLVAKMMRPQVAVRKICRRLGFREETLIPDYVRDQESEIQDLLIMTCDMKDFWSELEAFYGASDWRRCR